MDSVRLCDFRIAPRRECLSCFNDGDCVIADDMRGIYPRLLDADEIIFASPIFLYRITGWAKAMVDRCQALWARKYVLHDSSRCGRRLNGSGKTLRASANRGCVKIMWR